MKRQLFPCMVCKRHIREDEARCPFCAASPALLGLALLVGACSAEPERREAPPDAPPTQKVPIIESTMPTSAPLSVPASTLTTTPESAPASVPTSVPVTLPVTPTTKKVEAKPKPKPIVKPDPRPIPAYGRPPTPIFKEPVPLYGSPAIPNYNRGDDEDW
jgi:protein TonB